jgi:hypothetical protein
MSTPDDLAHLERIGIASDTTGWMRTNFQTMHYKYPQTVGADSISDNINFNSHDSSKYAKKRMTAIDTATHEPYMLFEFMKIREDKVAQAAADKTNAIGNSFIDTVSGDGIGENDTIYRRNTQTRNQDLEEQNQVDLGIANSWVDKTISKVSSWFKDLVHTADRDYIGSCALYMPTDIQINDQMVYNEDTRRIGGLMQAISDGKAGVKDVLNPQVLLQPEVMALMTAGLGMVGNKIGAFGSTATAVSTLASYGIGDILSTELQRSTGKVLNPNELLRYQQTALRSFSFNWTFLPDNEFESNNATAIIKMFRKAAHATRTSSTLITVPDHVIVSFHGAKDMVQIPPCYIESANVTYNPNVSSFFKKNNAPVEIGFSLTLKEIVPIYSDDVEGGF